MPTSFQTGKLGDLVTFKTGKLDSNAAVADGDYPFFTCSQETLRTNTYSFDTECVLLAGNNANGIFPLKYFNGKFDAYQRTYIVRPIDTNVLITKFLHYALQLKLAEFRSFSTGAATKFLTLTILNATEIQAPPLPTQQRIAGILYAYDELIENSQRRIKILESMARALYREWFVHFRFPGSENHPRVASALGEIPLGWEVKKLGELCSKLMDGTHDSPPPVELGFPLITGRHIRGGFIDFSGAYQISPEEHQKVMKRSRPECGDIIYSNIGTLGATAIVDQHFEFSIKNVALLKPLTLAHSSFLYCFLESPEKLSELTNKASGTSQKFFSLQFLRTLELVTPPESLIEQFSEKLAPILRTRSLLMKGIQNLSVTRNLLLPRLLSGQINVETTN